MRHRFLLFLATSLFVATIAAAKTQSCSPGNATQTPNQTSTSTPPTAKKVWTNDDVSGLRSDAPLSTVGSTDPKAEVKPAPAVRNRNANAYQARLTRLEAQIPPLERQIAELQAAIEGKPTGDAKTSQRPRGVKADDWNVELQQLEKKRDSIQDQIAALKDEARHHGIPPNTLP